MKKESTIYVFIEKDRSYYHPLKYTMELIAKNKQFKIVFVTIKSNADIVIGTDDDSTIRVSNGFYNDIENNIFDHNHHFKNDCFIKTNEGNNDLLSTIFYMVNCLQEYGAISEQLDHYGRFSYEHSYQYKYNVIEDNLVQGMINELMETISKLNKFNKPPQPSNYNITHDIDILYGGWKSEIKWCLSKGEIGTAIEIAFNRLMGKYPWDTIEELVAIDKKHGFKASFYWIPKMGKDSLGIKNADYYTNDDMILTYKEFIRTSRFSNHIHKSTFKGSISSEMKFLPFHAKSNRYHYLKFTLPEAWYDIEDARLYGDSSLMFANKIGFRNNYGYPFEPYDFKTKKAFDFTETPLHIMPGAVNYEDLEQKNDIKEAIFQFLDKNKNDALITILWHNNEYSDYQFKELKVLYEELLRKISKII